MIRILALIASLLASPALAQSGTATKQSGYVTPTHVTCWTTNGVIQDCGTPTSPYASTFATVGSGPTLCADSANPASGPYNQLCFTPTNTGGGFSWYNYNGATGVPSMTINGTVYPFPFQSSGGCVGPSTTIIGDAVTWGNTAGTLCADGGTLLVGMGNINASENGDPFSVSCIPVSFGGTWTCQGQIASTSTASHADGRATINIQRTAVGSGTFGPANQDTAVFLDSQKTNYLSSSVEGEIDGENIEVAQGYKGDASGMLDQVLKVYSTSGSATGGVVPAQFGGHWIDASGNILMDIHTIPSFGEGAGGLSNHTGYGLNIETEGGSNAAQANFLTPYTGLYVGAYDLRSNCPSYCPTFTNALTFSGSRASNGDDVFFNISMGLNQAGIITMGSGNADGQDGNPTLSGGTRLSFGNVGGAFTIYAANGSTKTLTLSQTGYANLLGGVVIGSTLAASTWGSPTLVLHATLNQDIIAEGSVNSGAALAAVNDANNAYTPFTLDGSTLYLANGGTNAITISGSQAVAFAGVVTALDGGTWGSGGINGSIIGGTTPASITGTTVRANSGFSANGTAGVSTTCTVTASDTLVFTEGILTTKGSHCT